MKKKLISLKKSTYKIDLKTLLSYEEKKFIYYAYQLILDRVPDIEGFSHYLDQVRVYGKMHVLRCLKKSTEAKMKKIEDRISGLNFATFKSLFKGKPVNKFLINNKQTKKQQLLNLENNKTQPSLWFDITKSMHWTEGLVGIVKTELEFASWLYKINESTRYLMLLNERFVEVPVADLEWLLKADKVADAYLQRQDKNKNSEDRQNELAYRFNYRPLPNLGANDIVLSVGICFNDKEKALSNLKHISPNLKIIYLIYDIILIHQSTRHFYPQEWQILFENYLGWASVNCDYLLFGGETAYQDTLEYQKMKHWPSPPGLAIRLGADIDLSKNNALSNKQLLQKIGISGPFILAVGTIEGRKNYNTLYRAYKLAQKISPDNLPQLIICGRSFANPDNLLDMISRDPSVANKIHVICATEDQKKALYSECLFTLLPSLYEGWSLTLSESLAYGKFCIASDTPPLREIGGELIEYVMANDVRAWAEKIVFYTNNPEHLKTWETKIGNEWKNTPWEHVVENVFDFIKGIHLKKQIGLDIKPKDSQLWFDLSTSYLHHDGGLVGIVRSQLMFARYLQKLHPTVKFFAYLHNRFFEISKNNLLWLFSDEDLSVNYNSFWDHWKKKEQSGQGYRCPYQGPGGHALAESADNSNFFSPNSIVLLTAVHTPVAEEMAALKNLRSDIVTSQLVYDLTPIFFPQYHHIGTVEIYGRFLETLANNFDQIIYGGKTAMRDGIAVQKQNGWKTPISDAIYLGNDLSNHYDINHDEDKVTLKKFGIHDNFIMSVGTIQPRKNHEILYSAYITLMDRKIKNIPQLVFVGSHGWYQENFLTTLKNDTRVQERIILIEPTDKELDVLYRHCLFTLLPSFYEGWSLTLPESLNYGKFCLTSNADPLVETGRDLVEYIDPLDTFAWADKINFYVNNPKELAKREQYIRTNWQSTSWEEATQQLLKLAYSALEAKQSAEKDIDNINSKPITQVDELETL